jgi:prepilin-type N-terminal cleavage/methylation domain-containing protein
MRIHHPSPAFSLIELVIVVVIIAIIGAIAIPKMSRGASGAGESALIQDLVILRSALDLYNAEHVTPLSSSNTADQVTTALTSYSDAAATTFSSTPTTTAILGPYLRALPSLPVGTNQGQTSFTTQGPPGTAAAGWYFNGTSFFANDPLNNANLDAKGVLYNSY